MPGSAAGQEAVGDLDVRAEPAQVLGERVRGALGSQLGEIAGALLESLDPSGDLTMRAADAPR